MYGCLGTWHFASSIQFVLHPLQRLMYRIAEATIDAWRTRKLQNSAEHETIWPTVFQVNKMRQVCRTQLVSFEPVF